MPKVHVAMPSKFHTTGPHFNRLIGITTPIGETNYTLSYRQHERRPGIDSSDDYQRTISFDEFGRVRQEHMAVLEQLAWYKRWVHGRRRERIVEGEGHLTLENLPDLLADKASQPIYLHCHHGKMRTSAALGAYWIRHHGLTAMQAVESMTSEYRFKRDEEPEFIEYMQQYEQYAKTTPPAPE